MTTVVGKSREGVRFSEYRWGLVLVTLPFALLFELCATLYSLLLRAEPVSDESVDRIPPNAIVFLFHTEIYGAFADWDLYRRIFGEGAVLGNHTFLSYVWSLRMYVKGFQMFRFHTNAGKRVLPDIVRYLGSEVRGRFGLRTDSGGPYEVVRKSVVVMSRESNRPLVPMRQIYDRAWRVRSHWIPKPYARVRTVIGPAIAPEELRDLPVERARDLVQARIDALR